ncbi:hypothetical protein I33_1346 [Bacillus subtilis subsp. subtilis str. RO-NN-1]|nr:hypothetical protein I33_1346 [Bacillus subtilis subsp. subtilis str. RO-NN-1]
MGILTDEELIQRLAKSKMSNKKISSSSSFKNKALQKELLIVLLIYS